MRKAALYLRSSKDRHDVSIDAQRRQLRKLAEQRQLSIVAEYTDVVESAASIDRPGFQKLLNDLRTPAAVRGWEALLILDTGRLGRRRWMGPVFRHEAARRGVEVIYNSMPDVDPVSRLVLESVLEAMDELHSITSRDKGIAGQVENVRKGYRAGGRAPIGYRLRKTDTGTTRDGQAVQKSTLEPDENAPAVARYLQLRARGVPRRQALRETQLAISQSGAVSLDWHALTYAGHTVYGVYAKHFGGEKKTRSKRRPRDEWLVQRDTHRALITEAEAEQILTAMETSKVGRSIREAKAAGSRYLLTGLLYSPDGEMWTGTSSAQYPGPRYRLKAKDGRRGRYVPCDQVDSAVLEQLVADLSSEEFTAKMLATALDWYRDTGDEAVREARQALDELDRRVAKVMEMAEQLDDPGPAMRRVNDLERGRPALVAEIERLEEERACRKSVQALTPAAVQDILTDRLSSLQNAQPHELKPMLRSLIGRVVLCPAAGDCQIQYRIQQPRSLFVASPRGRAEWTLSATSQLPITFRKAQARA